MKKALLLFVVITILSGCAADTSTDPVTPKLTVDMVKGNYSTTAFNLTENGILTDILAEGSYINLNLLVDGTTSGPFFIPKTITGDSLDIDLSLEGTIAIVNDSVALQHNADTFIRDIKWAFQDNQLTGKDVKSSDNIFVQLQK